MSLRGRIRAMRWPMVAAFTVLAVGADGHIPGAVPVVAMGALMLMVWLAPKIILWRALVRLSAAAERDDARGYRRACDELAAYYATARPPARLVVKLLEANALTFEERWMDARAVLDSIPVEQLRSPLYFESYLGAVLSQVGETDRALELARTALARAEADVPRMIATCRLNLGAALVLAGRFADAVVQLKTVRGRPLNRAFSQTMRSYYLGEALRGLGRLDEARAAYGQAVALKPENRWGRRAKARLAEAWTPYR
jgi:tetratricopeptide (TPR) repeat protein